jgi:hypothetical protein
MSRICPAQTIEKTFSGQWASTSWTFEFYRDGSFKRSATGHYETPPFTGTYSMEANCIHILTGFGNPNGTISLSEYYLIHHDSVLIDLSNLYDYALNTIPGQHLSKKRYDILAKENMDSVISITKKDFDSTIVYCFPLLKKAVTAIGIQDHVKIIRCYNTLTFNHDHNLKDKLYKTFIAMIREEDYVHSMYSMYDWIPNRGMGYYFQRLQIELLGTPHSYSMYTIIE